MKRPAKALLSAIDALERALEDLGRPHMMIGGIAVIAWGVTRHTDDADATVWGDGLDVADLLAVLSRHGIRPRIRDAVAFARRSRVLLVSHTPSATPMEISLAGLPFEEEALRRAVTVKFAGRRIRLCRPEDLVVYKAVAWRDIDRADVERLLVLHRASIDLARVRGLVRAFAEALEEPTRVAEFEAIVKRARGARARARHRTKKK